MFVLDIFSMAEAVFIAEVIEKETCTISSDNSIIATAARCNPNCCACSKREREILDRATYLWTLLLSDLIND